MTTTVERPADTAGELYFKTDVSPEVVFQAIGQLRKDARDEIDRLIRFLDMSDDYVSRELEDGGDDGPIDDNELDGDDTPSGVADDEPSLGSGAVGEWSTQARWSSPNDGMDREGDGCADDREGDELQHGGDEHDGQEPDNEGEPSLGWPERLRQDYACNGGLSDRELQDYATVVPTANRGKLPNTIDVKQRGYGGRTVIRNLTDGQTVALAQKMDRFGRISLT